MVLNPPPPKFKPADVCSDGPPRPVSESVSYSLRQRDG